MAAADPSALARRMRAHPGIARLAEAFAGVEGAHLVGGAVRDLLLGRDPVDLDVVVVGDAEPVAREVAERLEGEFAAIHDRFGTATVQAGELRFDVVSARAEAYAAPGALPDVRSGSLEDDLARRDFTVNALVGALWEAAFGRLAAHPRALEDLEAGVLRVLHAESFRDDPTRLLRLVRYGARLDFDPDQRTDALARDAIVAGALGTVSGNRIAGELLALAAEPTAIPALARAHAIGLDRALHPSFDARLDLAEAALRHVPDPAPPGAPPALGSARARRDLVVLATCCTRFDRVELVAWLDRLALPSPDRDAVVAAALDAESLAERLRHAHRASEIAGVARGRAPEELALAAAHGAADQVDRWTCELQPIALDIDGRDLAAAGVPEGPDVGRALQAALAAKLDGDAPTREAQLAAALRAIGLAPPA